MKKAGFLILLAVLVKANSFSQTFDWEAKLDSVKHKGFYNILLTTEITTHLKEDFSDIRIYDEKGKEVPYILRNETPKPTQQLFREYSIIENKSTPRCCSRLILENPDRNRINNISLIIRNSDVRKEAKLSGSDDKKSWYIIKDNYYLESIYNTQETSEVKILDFPLSDYQYYKLEIDDSVNGPLNIIKAGYYDTYQEENKFLTLPSTTIQQKDSSDKNSYATISFPSEEFIDRLQIDVEGPQYYYRNARVCQLLSEKKKKYFNTLLTFDLRSNQENVILFDHLRAKNLYLIIENNENQPLKIKAAKGFQVIHYLVANLEKGDNYFLRFGNPKVPYPRYDLEYFRDSIPEHVDTLIAIDLVSKAEKKTQPSESFFKTNTWIWAAIIIVIILLGYMTVKMIGDIKKEKQ